MITQARLHRILDYDPSTGIFRWKVNKNSNARRGWRAGCLKPNGYRHIGLDWEQYHEHRLAWFYVYGVWPPAEIDHINSDTSNNALSNLRLATTSQNQRNRTKLRNNTSGLKGVSWHKRSNKWQAQIKVNSKVIPLGVFATKQQAYAAYVAAAKRLHGAFARYA